ncbi:MAG: PUR family DNA/RNA-binding protein [Candidatus Shikimatogenerans bostrichidophilus]|nr:MAG: PUR family DNA/RNA-binding protein [Candidatus Shikimatogenerans bostrichidophilus]
MKNMEDKDKIKVNNYYNKKEIKEIYSKTLTSGNKRYFFDIRENNNNDYYLSITESKKFFLSDGRPIYRKHKIFLYKEDFKEFKEILSKMINYILKKKEKIKNNKKKEKKK